MFERTLRSQRKMPRKSQVFNHIHLYSDADVQLSQCMPSYHFSHFTLASQYKVSLAYNTSITICLKIFSLWNELVQRYILKLASYY